MNRQELNKTAFLKYPGAKWRIAKWISNFFPEHHSYLEPFFGSGAVFFSKDKSNIETINDLDGDVVNLFECIRKDPEKLSRYVLLTPYSREIYNRAYDTTMQSDNYERALYFLVRCNMGYGFRTSGGKVGWKRDVAGRERAYGVKSWQEIPSVIADVSERLSEVQIECMPAIELIKDFNFKNVLIYCDPPYLLSTRYGKQYKHEMSEDDHLHLLDAIKKHRGPVIISGYQSSLYDTELCDWHKEITTTTDRRSQVKTEVLWMNFNPIDQISIF